jgi:hypothetical protein
MPQPHFAPGKNPVPIVQEAGWAPGSVWTGAENLAPPGFDPRTVQPVVLCGGSNDIARNNSIVGMKHLLEFAINANHTNVILMSALHTYDLIRNSCVNNEVEVFNRKLRKRLEKFG